MPGLRASPPVHVPVWRTLGCHRFTEYPACTRARMLPASVNAPRTAEQARELAARVLERLGLATRRHFLAPVPAPAPPARRTGGGADSVRVPDRARSRMPAAVRRALPVLRGDRRSNADGASGVTERGLRLPDRDADCHSG